MLSKRNKSLLDKWINPIMILLHDLSVCSNLIGYVADSVRNCLNAADFDWLRHGRSPAYCGLSSRTLLL